MSVNFSCVFVADYIFDYLTIVVAVGGFSLVSTFHQALTYTFKVVIHSTVSVMSSVSLSLSQNPFQVFGSVEYWMFTLVCMAYTAFGILSLTEAGTIEFRSKLLPTVLALPFLHLFITYFASPQPYLSAWGAPSYQNLYEH